MFFSLLAIAGGVGVLGFILYRKKFAIETFKRAVFFSMLIAVTGAVGMIFSSGESIEDAAARVSNAQFTAEGYAAAKIAKEKFPDAKNIVVAGIGEPRDGVMKILKDSGYPSATYIKLFDSPPFGANEFEIMKAIKAASLTPEFSKAEIIVTEYSFPGYAKKILESGQKKIIYFGSTPDKTLWDAGIIAVQLSIKQRIEPKSFPENPDVFFNKMYDIKMNTAL